MSNKGHNTLSARVSQIKGCLLVCLYVMLVVAITHGKAYAQPSQDVIKANLILSCSESVEWKNYKSPTEFSIAVYGSMPEELIPLREQSKTRRINDRPIVIKHFRRIKEMTPTDVVYINNKANEELEDIYNYATANKSLVITDRAPSDKYFMLNILLHDNDKQFEVNAANAKDMDCIVTDKLTNQGGSTLDLRVLYNKKSKEIKAKEERLQLQEEELVRRQAELDEQIKKNEQVQKENTALAKQLRETEYQIEAQKATAAMLMAEVETQQSKLALNQRKLNEQDQQITRKQEQVDEANKELRARENELLDREEKIRQQEDAIDRQDITINQQRTAITGVIIFIVVVIFLIILIIRSIRERARANIALRRKNQELNQQKEEIDKQAAQLEGVNKELEKLSIVAGKTQNAIVIMDRNGYFEWVNAGFTRFFGYTLQLLRNERDENIVNVSGNKSIRNILFKCVSNKQTIVFESDSHTRSGKKIATQTTLTPILNEKGDVTQLVAIYSDINKLKEQEAAIRSQNEELLQQKNTLEMQKTQIEEQTKSIKRGIDYAQTIQRTILPPNELIQQYFDCFVLFRPKDIVSGDFYWFSTAQDGDRQYQFIGDFDCTGHGVPGAFMSLIGNRVLNEVINVRSTYSPRDIMDALNAGIIKALKQDQSTNNDGMDTCLCRVEKLTDHDYKVVFCGAKRPLYYVPTDATEVQQLKGDRKSIGGTQKKRGNVQFTDQEIILHSGDTMFLCSDGISDQCDHERKKFGSDRFVNMILQYRNEPMERQGDLFSKELDDFRGNEEQRDDISVIGIKFR
ncbi:MAG: DUF4154 domain-containing protein [Bacteroidales bacterium]|nr:DUF4154 domain-containing protein [Bacteroidales bacterium]